MAGRLTLGKEERLVREKDIETLFRTGEAFSAFPIRVVYRLAPLAAGERFLIRAGFSAPKRKFKKAVDRNRIKRLLREAWRHRKSELLTFIPESIQLQVFLMFTAPDLPGSDIITAAVAKAVVKLQKILSKPTDA